MATPTELEPVPRDRVLPWSTPTFSSARRHSLSRPGEPPPRTFLEVLRARRSRPRIGTIHEGDLSCLLWHSMLIRERRPGSSNYLEWESRACPSAGGLHPIHLLCLPLDGSLPLGIYDPRYHEILVLGIDRAPLILANALSVERLCNASSGLTLQFVADRAKTGAAYLNGESLPWRDAGALSATIGLVAEALRLAATPLGRTGDDLLAAAGLTDQRWMGVGAIHITGSSQSRTL